MKTKVKRRDKQRKVENRLNPAFQVEVLNADDAENAREANGDCVALFRNFRRALLHFSFTIDPIIQTATLTEPARKRKRAWFEASERHL